MTVSIGVKGITTDRQDIIHEGAVEEITEVEEDEAGAAEVVLDDRSIRIIRLYR